MAYLGFVPPGVVLPFAGATAPQGWILCDGTAISRSVYASLFAALSTTYGVGDGSTTFNLPDMRGVYARGAGTNGTANYGGVTGHTPAGGSLGSKGGQKTAKNGLSNASSNVTVTGTNSSGSVNGGHGISVSASGNNNNLWHNTATTLAGGDGSISGTNTILAASFGTNPQTWTQNSGSAAAQTITGDSETTPAFLAMNYIIKI